MRSLNNTYLVILLVVIALHIRYSRANPCLPRTYSNPVFGDLHSFVCVCNSTYCDEVGETAYPTDSDGYTVYESGKDRLRLTKRSGTFKSFDSLEILKILPDFSDINIKIDTSRKYQSIQGFGGCFTDAAGINYKNLTDQKLQQSFIDSYFSSRGIQYSIGRIPIGSNDASTHVYSYDDVSEDVQLNHFSLPLEDNIYKIPMMKAAQKAANGKLIFFGSPWSAPGWMKTTGKMAGGGQLKGKPGGVYFKAWAQYFVKFIQEYNKHNIPVWGLTAQNEPTNLRYNTKFQQMYYTPDVMRDFIKTDLGPALNSAGLGHVKLMIIDDQRLYLPFWAQAILSDPEARKYVSGIAVHWYFDEFIPANILSHVQKKYPDMFILATEGCVGSQPWDPRKVILGSWSRAEKYAKDIIADLNNYAVGWIDWNLDVNVEGGPNWVNNFVDSPILINVTKNHAEFLKQPTYYALGHFSKFLPPGSVRVDSTIQIKNVDGVAFVTPDHHTVLIVLNKNSHSISIGIDTDFNNKTSRQIKDAMPANSIQTYIWKTG